MNNTTKRHSPFAQFAATCMYFGAELITTRVQQGVDADVPVGQSITSLIKMAHHLDPIRPRL